MVTEGVVGKRVGRRFDGDERGRGGDFGSEGGGAGVSYRDYGGREKKGGGGKEGGERGDSGGSFSTGKAGEKGVSGVQGGGADGGDDGVRGRRQRIAEVGIKEYITGEVFILELSEFGDFDIGYRW